MFLLQELVKLQHMHAILVHCVPFSIYWEKPASLEDELLVWWLYPWYVSIIISEFVKDMLYHMTQFLGDMQICWGGKFHP